MTAAICYLEIPAPDVQKASVFYNIVFGWEVQQSHLGDQPYSEFSTGSDQLTGGFDSRLKPSDEGTLLYLKVQNMDETLSAISVAGGKILRSKFEIGGGHGFSALFTDPNGNKLGLFSKT